MTIDRRTLSRRSLVITFRRARFAESFRQGEVSEELWAEVRFGTDDALGRLADMGAVRVEDLPKDLTATRTLGP